MNAWERSWSITRTSFDVVWKDREMLWFPILSGIFSILLSVALIVPSFVLNLLNRAGAHDFTVGPLQIAALFGTYFGLSFIATFFNVCVVYTTRVRLDGGDATFGQSIQFAFSRVHLIAGWSVVSATVGILLHGLESIARRSGLIGRILLGILRVVLAGAWSVMTVFVVPSMVYRGLGPIDAIKDSWDTLKRTWGESAIGYYGVGIASFVCALPAILLVCGAFALMGTAPAAGVAVLVLGLLMLGGVMLVFSLISTVYRTALYHYAAQGTVPAGFEAGALAGAFRTR